MRNVPFRENAVQNAEGRYFTLYVDASEDIVSFFCDVSPMPPRFYDDGRTMRPGNDRSNDSFEASTDVVRMDNSA